MDEEMVVEVEGVFEEVVEVEEVARKVQDRRIG